MPSQHFLSRLKVLQFRCRIELNLYQTDDILDIIPSVSCVCLKIRNPLILYAASLYYVCLNLWLEVMCSFIVGELFSICVDPFRRISEFPKNVEQNYRFRLHAVYICRVSLAYSCTICKALFAHWSQAVHRFLTQTSPSCIVDCCV